MSSFTMKLDSSSAVMQRPPAAFAKVSKDRLIAALYQAIETCNSRGRQAVKAMEEVANNPKVERGWFTRRLVFDEQAAFDIQVQLVIMSQDRGTLESVMQLCNTTTEREVDLSDSALSILTKYDAEIVPVSYN